MKCKNCGHLILHFLWEKYGYYHLSKDKKDGRKKCFYCKCMNPEPMPKKYVNFPINVEPSLYLEVRRDAIKLGTPIARYMGELIRKGREKKSKEE